MCQKISDFVAYDVTLRLFGIVVAVKASSMEKIHFLAVAANEI
jgi:hypothetical protein